jgi:hypothetical protein
MSTEPMTGTFHDALTGETIVRPLTPEEAEALNLMHNSSLSVEGNNATITDNDPIGF